MIVGKDGPVVVVDGPKAAYLADVIRKYRAAECRALGWPGLPAHERHLLAELEEAGRYSAGIPSSTSPADRVTVGEVVVYQETISVDAAATTLGCSQRAVRGLLARGTVQGFKKGGVWHVSAESVRRYRLSRAAA